MPRYFFHVHDGTDRPDREGVDLPSLAEAREQAVVTAAEMLRDIDGAFWRGPHEWVMRVVDKDGRRVCVLTFHGDE
jgi:hypothetical protein